MNCSVSILDCDVHYSELFSLFENAQDYFNNSHEAVFHDLFNNVGQLPTKIVRLKASKVQLEQRYLVKLRSIRERLRETSMRYELCREQCEHQRKSLIDLENKVTDEKNEYKDLEKEFVSLCKDCTQLELEWLHMLSDVADNTIKRLASKISMELNEMTLPEHLVDRTLNLMDGTHMQ
ncbi:hypothetical protein DICVIV_03051 [Dictyocaulus viviparus]|uniref:Uncharacterized protein n=1 Tax=Dictyocaulus viviparus TaxID=29172 RepID=A0A0D8Y3Q3_DICVI|nr:hypothetical protein DICVIV_03051 [Dictyocaulus viviparus]